METGRSKMKTQLWIGLYLNLTPFAVCVAAGDKTIRLSILEPQIPPINVFHNTSLKKETDISRSGPEERSAVFYLTAA
jgi:hypothetical protein